MKTRLLISLLLLSLGLTTQPVMAGVIGPCKIKEMNQSDTTPNYMYVKMSCQGVGMPTTCTNISTDTVVYDATVASGQLRTSMLLAAFAAGKDVRITTWGACPSDASSTARVYSVALY